MNMKLHSTLPLIIGALVFLDSANSLPSSWCCYDRRQKRHICVDSNEEDQFIVEDDGTQPRQIRNYCVDSNEDFESANTETADYGDFPGLLDYDPFDGKRRKYCCRSNEMKECICSVDDGVACRMYCTG